MRTVVWLCVALVVAGCASDNRPLQLISGAGPVYPPEARQAGIEGFVIVRYDVTQAGQVTNAQVVEAQPAGLFDGAALTAVRSWRFKAPLVDGQVQYSQGLESTVTFALGDTSRYDQYD